MTKPNAHVSMRIVINNGEPWIESRLRAIGDDENGLIPKRKILVYRSPLTPGSGEADIETELIDDDGSDDAFCPDCAAGRHDPEEALRSMASAFQVRPQRKAGRNDPCPCGSGRKYKRCCLN